MSATSEIKKPWYKTIYRWGQTNLTENDPAVCDLGFWRRQWKATGVQGLIVNCGGIVAYYPSRHGLQYRAAMLGDKDYFKEWSDAAREDGIAVIARMDINRATKEFYDAHPDWFCVDKDGKALVSQDRYFSCVNSGYYKEYIPSVLVEIIERYSPVGFADNSWKGMGRKTVCYCDNCRTKFRKEYHLELPENVSWDNPTYREWVRWSYKCRTENWDLFNETTKRAGGEDCLWLGMIHADPVNASGSFCDLKEICARSEIILSDHQSRDGLNGFEQNGLSGTLLRLASDESVLVPESFANYVRGDRSFRLASNPEPETRMWMLDGIAGGISPWYHHIGGSQNDSRQFKTPLAVFKWHSENEDYLYDRTDLANVGLVWNQNNADFYGRDDAREKCSLPWRGFGLALSKSRIPFLPINAADIAKYAGRLNTLVLADMAVLSPEQLGAVCDFVSAGGNLVMTGCSATLDADGNPSQDDRLWKLLGLKHSGKTMGVFGKQTANWEFYDAHNYFRLPDERHAVLDGFEDTRMLPFGGGLQLVESTGALKPVASYIPAFPIYPPEFAWIREERPDIGTIFAGTLKSGSRVVYFAGDVDRCCGREKLPDHARLLSNAVAWAAGDSLPLDVEGPGHLDCKIYRKGDQLMIHVVNLSGCDMNPGYCEEILPVGPVTVKAAIGGLTPSVATLKVSGKTVPVKVEGGHAVVTLEKVNDHELIVLS